MRNIVFLSILILGLLSCSNTQNDLDRMGAAVKQHIQNNDIENETATWIDNIRALSYKRIEKGNNPEEVYLCRVFIQGKWSYLYSNRIFNMNDTINCYFNSKKIFVRMDNIYAN